MTTPLEKVAAAYAEAEFELALDDALDKVASAYGPNIPPAYQEALVKEAFISQVGHGVTKGVRMLGAAFRGAGKGTGPLAGASKTVGSGLQSAAKTMGRHTGAVGGVALGAGGVAAAGTAALGAKAVFGPSQQ